MKKYIVELIGTFWLVFCGCGSALFAATFPDYGIGFVGVEIHNSSAKKVAEMMP